MSAIPNIKNLNEWSPLGDDKLDIRLAAFPDTEKMNKLFINKIEENPNIKRIYTQDSCITIKSFKKLIECDLKIKELNLSGAYFVGDSELEILKLPELEELNLSFAYGRFPVQMITDKGVSTILDNCTNLKKLDLSGTKITNKTLEKIATKPLINFLRIFSCNKITAKEIKDLKTSCPDLKVVTESHKDNAKIEFIKFINEIKSRLMHEYSVNGEGDVIFKSSVTYEERKFINYELFNDNSLSKLEMELMKLTSRTNK